MENLKILEDLFDIKKLKVLRLFYREKGKKFYLREVAKEAGVPLATTYRIMQKLVALNLIDIITLSKFKVFVLAQNENTIFLESFLKESKKIMNYFIDELKKISEIEAVILHGDEEQDKANVLMIGENIDPNTIKRICGFIKEQYNFTISALTLTKEQFAQMSSMGLYSGKKKIVYKKEDTKS